jgi:hypothetical protein
MWGQTRLTPLFASDRHRTFVISTAESALAGIAALVPVRSRIRDQESADKYEGFLVVASSKGDTLSLFEPKG